MTLDEAIKNEENIVGEQEELYALCPASEHELFRCDGIKDCKVLKNGKNKGCQKCAEEHRQLADWLKELKQLREQKWIPVSERLPEIHQDVILSLRSLDVVVGFKAETEPYFYHYGYIDPQNVLAWMPLPKPYEPQESEVKEC